MRRGASALGRRLKRAVGLLGGLCRELSDQNAYARHLAIHGVAHSPAEWRRFSDRRLKARFEQTKCC